MGQFNFIRKINFRLIFMKSYFLGTSSIGGRCKDCSEFAQCRNGICHCRKGFIGDGITCDGIIFSNFTMLNFLNLDVNECKADEENSIKPEKDLIIELLSNETTTDSSNASSIIINSKPTITIIVELNKSQINLKHNCATNAFCENNNGSYFCECEVGFAGNGRVCTQDKSNNKLFITYIIA